MPPGLCPRHHERCRRAPVRVCIPLPGCRGTAGRKVPFVRRTRVTPPYLSPRCRLELNEVLSDNLCVSRLIFRFLEIRFGSDLLHAPVRSKPALLKIRVEVRLVTGKFAALKAENNALLPGALARPRSSDTCSPLAGIPCSSFR